MDKKRPKNSAPRRGSPAATTIEQSFRRQETWKHRASRSSSVLWLKLGFTIKAARLQTLKRQKYQHLQEEALLKARGLLKNWEDGPVLLTEDLYSRARSEHDAQELINYTPEALALRFSLRNNPDVIDAVKQLWSVDLPRDEMGCIDQKGYASLFRRIGRSLDPDATKRRLRRMEKTIQEDWIRDSKGEPVMGFANFFDSVFELADLWCETIDVDEYIAFLRRLVLRVSTVRRTKHDPSGEVKRLLRPLLQIKAIDDDEESSSSEEEIAPVEVLDDEVDLSSGGDDDDDDKEEEVNLPVQLPPPVTPTHSIGFIATKILQTFRAETPPLGVGIPQSTNTAPEPVPEERSWSRDRRASIITLGLGGLGNFAGFSGNDKEAELKTPTGLRGSSAKSRVTSAKDRTSLVSVRENGIATSNTEEDERVNALVAMHRLRSAQPRTPIVVEDSQANNVIPSNNVPLNVGRPITALPQKKQQRNANLFTAALGAPKTEHRSGINGLLTDGLHGTLASSAPQLATPDGLKPAIFGNVDAARVGSRGTRKAMLSSSSKEKQQGDRKPAGIIFDEQAAAKGKGKRLAALGVGSTISSQKSSHNQEVSGMMFNSAGTTAEEEDAIAKLKSSNPHSDANGPREYVSGQGVDTSGNEIKNGGPASRWRNRTDMLPVNPTLPFYTFDENASPAKRLLPPVMGDSGIRGRSGARSGKTSRQGRKNTGRGSPGPDFSGSYKTTGYLTGSLQAEIIARTQWSSAGSRTAGERSLQQGATPLWFPLPGKETRISTQRKITQKRSQKQSTDDGCNDFMVSPWDSEFDNEPDDGDLARAVPSADKHRGNHQWMSPRESVVIPAATSSSKQEETDLDLSAADPPTISVSSSMVPPEPPSCVSELTTLPQEYHDLVLGGSSISNYKGLSKTEGSSAPDLPATNSVKIISKEPQWMLPGRAKPPLTLLEDGIEGRTVPGNSPRSTLTSSMAKRYRRERDIDDEDDAGLCPRFVEHLESHGDRSASAPSPMFRTDKPKLRCTCNNYSDGEDYDDSSQELDVHCPRHGRVNNNREEEAHEEDCLPLDAQEESLVEDVTVIVNATRRLVLRPGAKDRLAAKRARYNQQATRSEMMRRRCQYTFAKHLN
ncbi:unnamed protein product [Phytophthora fragariaefolia]|uniref:Unnamed protein product n=1 Tax=Phytophthora fragariaefolia TaxID=1490495 RepID=A0A9W6XAT5_9STRA|nr:unnamed protein product [Phytophthora fragariaefolia]